MTHTRLIWRNLRRYASTNLALTLCIALSTGVIISATVLSMLVRQGLHQTARQRRGQIQTAVIDTAGFFRADLARKINAPSSAVMFMPGAGARQDETARANDIQLLGIDSSFFKELSPNRTALDAPNAGEVYLNATLAERLNAKMNEEVLLIASRPTLLSRDSTLGRLDKSRIILSATVKRILTANEFGDFALTANTNPPSNAFVNRQWLAKRLDQPGRANLLLSAKGGDWTQRLETAARLDDLNLQVARSPIGQIELRSSAVFLKDETIRVARQINPDAAGVMTWVVNSISANGINCPYSTVTGLQKSPLFEEVIPPEMTDSDIVINAWLADDLQVKAGDKITLKYMVLQGDDLVNRTRTFRVIKIVPMKGLAADPTFMPDYPGISEEEDCREWKAGFEIDYETIRDKDEAYWDNYRGTPKAFVTLSAAQSMWPNRFGKLTALRFANANPNVLKEKLESKINPSGMGWLTVNVAEKSGQAASQAMDFTGIFQGLSFFLVVSAILLAILAGSSALQPRKVELTTLRALGISRRILLVIYGMEFAAVSFIGALIGVLGGLVWARIFGMLLKGPWKDAMFGDILHWRLTGELLCISLGVAIGVSLISTIILIMALRKTVAALRSESAEITSTKSRCWGRRMTGIVLLLGIGGAAALIFSTQSHSGLEQAGMFFGAGFLLLIAGLSLCYTWLSWPLHPAKFSRRWLIFRELARRPGRTTSIIAVLAVGAFLTLSIQAFRLNSDSINVGGGYNLWATSSLPVVKMDFFKGLDVFPMRLREGDSASCLNLNRAQTPALLGIDFNTLKKRFEFIPTPNVLDLDPGTICAIADEPTLKWALNKSIGEGIFITDQAGRKIPIVFVGMLKPSVFQGYVLLDEKDFLKLYPASGGRQVFLIHSQTPIQTAAELNHKGADLGLAVESTASRMARFNQVQNTYLDIFSALGGLALIFGSVGFGLMVWRDALRRRSELAILNALGLCSGWRWALAAGPAMGLLILGAGLGWIMSLLALMTTQGASIQTGLYWLTGILAIGFFSVLLAGWAGLRGRTVQTLQEE